MKLLPAILVFCGIQVSGQWELDTRLTLDGDSSSNRQILNVDYPVNPSDGVSAGVVRNQELVYAELNGGGGILLNPVPAIAAYSDGMLFSLVLANASDSAATLNVNGLGAVPIVQNGTIALDSADLAPNRPYHVLYHGGVFHLLSTSNRSCPQGFEVVTSDFCMESSPSPASTFYSAGIQCSKKGARLCTMSEWMRGCKKLDLTSTIGTWEWVDSAANHSGDAKVMGLDAATQSMPDCEYGRTRSPYLTSNVRCCYSR
jgi:hypothetical protein